MSPSHLALTGVPLRPLAGIASTEQVARPRPILVVEDDADDLFLLERALKKAAITDEIIHFGHHEQAIDYLDTLSLRPPITWPWVAFLDVKMPCGGGFEILKWLQSRPENTAIPFVILSGSIEPRDVEQAQSLGAFCYLQKPARFDQLAWIAAVFRH